MILKGSSSSSRRFVSVRLSRRMWMGVGCGWRIRFRKVYRVIRLVGRLVTKMMM